MNEYEILRFVLDNAVRYDGKADLGSSMGLLLGAHPELKAKAKSLMPEIKKIVDEVNNLSLREQKAKLEELGEVVRPEKEEREKVPELKNTDKLVVRFAPNPNGALSFGHCRPGLWNWFIKEKYKGKYILRFDDTDPKIKVPLKEAYGWIKEDLKWLGVKPNKVVIQSKRLKTYYKYAKELINMRKAYVCTCNAEEKKRSLRKGLACPCRDLYQTDRWDKMFEGYKQGEAVLRIKTDLEHPNPAIRDWAAFRIVDDHKHPLEKKAKVWPLLNFASAIDDYEFKVTHILRGIDLRISDDRQKYIYKYFGWRYPETIYNGKLFVEGIKSTSEIKELIDKGIIKDWDDPSLGTIGALKRRGFSSESIVRFIWESGISRADTNVSLEALAAFNREAIDKKTKRFFFVESPQKIKIENAPFLDVSVPSHPDVARLGIRNFKTNDEFFVNDKLEKGVMYRFMHLFNFSNAKFYSAELDKDLKAKLIHWIPVSDDVVNVQVLMPDGSVRKGVGEVGLKKLKISEVVQFERFGFVRLDKIGDFELAFVFSHK
ncbi:glutamate--tRNA ligase [archaeon]|nr:glutamate--tRNA ligase [archaeon]